MTILPIVVAPDERLLVCSQQVETVDQEVKNLLDDMLETMRDANGVGLAAVQVGVHKRIFVAEIPEKYVFDKYDEFNRYKDYKAVGGPYFVINPVITEYSDDSVVFKEGCLSIPKQRGEVSRPRRITVEGLDYNGNKQVIKARGLLARCVQHEIDHLNGKLYIEHLSKLKYDMAIKKAHKVKKLLSQ
ncbi:MAG: peptide deformylase [Rickettsiaceae bacterium H1]|nr:peptide deformylase [Rickettsiaceae bacterium H1]